MTTDGIQNCFSRAQIAEALEISGNQILQYQERGLLAERTAHAQDIAYNSLDIARLRFILRCEAAGYQGSDVADFVGTISKGASIKDQLKASLVHAHQKFSYVNAQKRKADILEQVSLQADADLIQKYIDEMKEILANPKSSPISAPIPKVLRPSNQPVSEQETRFEPLPERLKRPESKSEKPSRLKVGLERSQKFPPEHQKSSPQKSEPQKDVPSSAPPKPVTPIPQNKQMPERPRNKFIDSSTGPSQYGQRSSDISSDMFASYSTSPKRNTAAWKQTLITFLLLSILSIAGYSYYVVKYQRPSSLPSENSDVKDISSALKNILAENEEDKPSNSDDLKSTSKASNSPSPQKKSTASNNKVDQNATTVPPKKSDQVEIKNTPARAPKQENHNLKESTASGKNADIQTTSPTSAADQSKPKIDKTDPEEINKTPKTDETNASLSNTAMKDLDDILAKKQRLPQQPSEVYDKAERPQIAVYDFKIFYQTSRKILVAKFKMARIRPQNIVRGRLFVVFKPRQSSQSESSFSIPSTSIVDGIPAEPFKGIEFSFTGSSKVQSVRAIYVRDPSQFDVATVFVFSRAGELVLRKDFTVNITEY